MITKDMAGAVAIIAACLGAMIGIAGQTVMARADLIQRGLAEYCATDGRFAFKGEC